jgi:hypothetical protein
MFSKLIQDACKVTQKASQDSCLNTRTSNLYSKRKTVETTPTNQKKPEKHNLAKTTRKKTKIPIDIKQQKNAHSDNHASVCKRMSVKN